MSQEFTLIAQNRSDLGKAASRRLRRLHQFIPAIVYGAKKAPDHIQLKHNHVAHALQNEAFYSRILTLSIDNKKEQVVIKALQRHPYKPIILHMDFMRISAKEKLQMQVPLHIVGEADAPGLKQGGVLSHQTTSIEIRCMPADLPEFIEVDISQLELDQIIHLEDIKIPKGVESIDLLHENNPPVATIHIPKVAIVEEEPDTEAKEGEGKEGEEGEGKENAEDKKEKDDSSKK